MTDRATVYKAHGLAYLFTGVAIMFGLFIGFILPHIIEGTPLATHEFQGLIGIYAFCILFSVAPFGFKLEVG